MAGHKKQLHLNTYAQRKNQNQTQSLRSSFNR